MPEIIIKEEIEKKNIGGHKPFGVDLDPNEDLCLAKGGEKGQTAFYKGKKIPYMDYVNEVCTRGEKNKQGKDFSIGTFAGFGKGTLKKPYMENTNG